MNTRFRILQTSSALALALAVSHPVAWAEEEIPYDVAKLFFELNHTDGDLGIHMKVDGDAWKKLEVEDIGEREILEISVRGRLRRQGLTELAFESAEPGFDELSPEEFLDRFPEGSYEIEGRTIDGEELESEVQISHVLPAPAAPRINGELAPDGCDGELPVIGAGDAVVVSWDPVTTSHPHIGTPNVAVDITDYEIVVEIDETPFKSTTILPPSDQVLSFRLPDEILALGIGGEVKIVLLTREANNNNTQVESCFEIEE